MRIKTYTKLTRSLTTGQGHREK